jgi:hypothetical protein
MTTITYYEQRGWLTYSLDRPEYGITERTVPGWFMLSLDGQTITMRKVGGRNRFRFVRTSEVIEFTADPTAK